MEMHFLTIGMATVAATTDMHPDQAWRRGMDWTLEMEYVRTVFESCVATYAQLNPRGTVVGRDVAWRGM